ncbi:hypothetical protein IRZ71_20850 [Flavobacterium sp. ANB]|uniref:hypothetical protein n=1 Tax=unclassified Flavobacterium TaxID=196869 RepID=UPI0012B8FCFF|nr:MULTISPECIES: hypothetical protein [unclassified Flavobacterium]MBF4518812.1 hypothetical protein [Flavobacterium sp. ANB]MTD71475.1 hypothetical protein [Flavobacterium sp. LC2016-13]
MENTITVNEAISKGKIRLVHLPMIVIIGIIILGFILYYMKIVPGCSIPITFVLGFLCGWLTWSYFVNKWKIWAFENVRNVNELRRKAVDQKLIWENDSWFEKTEFKSLSQKIKLEELEKKFLENDVYKDDISIPKETLIFYSKNTLIFLLIISLGLISLGVYFLWEKEYFAIFISAFGFYMAYEQIKKLSDNDPQIIINDKGIQLKNKKLKSWSKIYNDRVFTRSSGKNSRNYLSFNNEMIEIDDLSIKFDELETLLHVYRVRFENNH